MAICWIARLINKYMSIIGNQYVDTMEFNQYRKLAEKERQLEIVNDFILELTSKIGIEEIVWCIAKKVVARLGFVDCVVYLYDEERDVLVQKAAHGPKNPIEFDIKNPILKGSG